MGDHIATPATSTQVAHPYRAAARTGFQITMAILSAIPLAYSAFTMHDPALATGAAGQVIAVSAGISRVMNLPVVDAFIRAFLPWLAATPTAPAAPVAASQNAG
jgi:hypothetical protein